ncbi:MAG: C25 family cysteine peptidase, partial [Candidatus Promineifilaceae bacterium]|nr:C25 family cysteine peptidase [Candidatus Promineifilaceae bacterium]
ATDFVDNDGDGQFDLGDRLRFYGWTFDGPRLERQFVTENVFWLWDGGSATRMENAAPASGTPPLAADFPQTVTHEEEAIFTYTYSDQWDQFPNEPDAWYWKHYRKPVSGTAVVGDHTIELPDPAPSGAQATVTAEFFSHSRATQYSTYTNQATVSMNGRTEHQGTHSWLSRRSDNVSTNVPHDVLVSGPNTVTTRVEFENAPMDLSYFLNRVTVAYRRQFLARDNMLIFTDDSGPHTYRIGSFTVGEPEKLVVWDISERRLPSRVADVEVTGNGAYTYTFASTTSTPSFIVANEAAEIALPASAIERYTAPSLEPESGGADWIAITHPNFRNEAERLAAHRGSYSRLKTHVVNIDDVIAQYGYGLPLPQAIRSYLAHALDSWSPAPRYVVLVGDANLNPRGLPCVSDGSCRSWYDPQEENYLLTDLVFKDRFQGLVPSDHTLVLLSGEDLVPDMAIGRLPVATVEQAGHVVDKIIRYETNLQTPQPYHKNILFVADDEPVFYGNNLRVGEIIGGQIITEPTNVSATAPFVQHHWGLAENVDTVPELLTHMGAIINGDAGDTVPDGAVLLNYRGHGSVQYWAGNPTILSVDDSDFWFNPERPVVILSLDCLDGNFAIPGRDALSETFLRQNTYGTVAHWSSAGLGYDYEHLLLHEAFYVGLLEEELSAIGDVADYSKLIYAASDPSFYGRSELYTFVLQGDPAMQLLVAEPALTQRIVPDRVHTGGHLKIILEIENNHLLPVRPILINTLPEGAEFVSASSTAAISTTVEGAVVTIRFLDRLHWQTAESITVTAHVGDDFEGATFTNRASVTSRGFDGDETNNDSSVTIPVTLSAWQLYLPSVRRE